jgi:putative endonuclease
LNHRYFTYITTNKSKRVLIGMTNNLEQRIVEHYLNRGNGKSFAGRYNCYHLLFWEEYQWVHDVIAREKELKGWSRQKKLI